MSSWSEIERAAPDLARVVQERFLAHKHLTMASLRRDGAPRISGTEVRFQDGELWLAGMPGSRKLADLRRDGRVAVHSGSTEPPDWSADAKVAGVAEELTDPAALHACAQASDGALPPFELFRLDVLELVHVGLGTPADHLVIESWHEGRGRTSVRR